VVRHDRLRSVKKVDGKVCGDGNGVSVIFVRSWLAVILLAVVVVGNFAGHVGGDEENQ
jgi:hypothetical protein